MPVLIGPVVEMAMKAHHPFFIGDACGHFKIKLVNRKLVLLLPAEDVRSVFVISGA